MIKEWLFSRYIAPTEKAGAGYVGVEIEMPVVNFHGGVDFSIVQKAAEDFGREFHFTPADYDLNGQVYSMTDEETGDNLSFDCSYNNLELSFARERTIVNIDERFRTYVTFLNQTLAKDGYILTGMGVNPQYQKNKSEFLPVPRYQMLCGFLHRAKDWAVPMYFHPYVNFATFSSASQVQLDVHRAELIPALRAFSLVEPIAAVLFANSYFPEEPGLLCARDLFWENSTHGINPHNIGMFDRIPASENELLSYILGTSIFCTERDGHYVHFHPIPIAEYFERDRIDGEYYENDAYVPLSFSPEKNDLSYLRTYKFEDLTFRGTIEHRSACCQPFADAMTVAAFRLGLSENVASLSHLLSEDEMLYHRGYSAQELRKLLNRRTLPEWVDGKVLSELCLRVLNLAADGLKKRNYGEDKFLSPLFDRAETLTSPAAAMLSRLENGETMDELIRDYAKL